jgi:hypothetical protein
MTAFTLPTKETAAFRTLLECGGFLCRQRKCSHRGPPRGASCARIKNLADEPSFSHNNVALPTTYIYIYTCKTRRNKITLALVPPPLHHLNLTQLRRAEENPKVEAQGSSDNSTSRYEIVMFYNVHLKHVNVTLFNIKLAFHNNVEKNMNH